MARTSSERPVVVYVAIAANLAITITKFIIAVMTSSSSLLSEAFHSTIDTADQLLLLLGKHLSSRPPDEKHPYGHGREYYFWGLIVAIVLFGFGGGMSVYEGVTHLMPPSHCRVHFGPTSCWAPRSCSRGHRWHLHCESSGNRRGERHFGRRCAKAPIPDFTRSLPRIRRQ